MRYIIIFTLLLLLTLPQFAFAQNNACQTKAGDTPLQTLPKCINQIYIWSLGGASLLALLVLVGGGYMVMTAQGNGEQATKGKDMILGAIIGISLLFLAYILLRTINPDLVNFNLDSVKTPQTTTPSGPSTPRQ